MNSNNTTSNSNTTPREEIEQFLNRNFPQIQMHGGESSIREINKESGTVHIVLGGTCNGCGISPLTTQSIKRRLPKEVSWVESVQVTTGRLDVDGPQINPDLVDSSDDSDEPMSTEDGVDSPF